MSMTIAKVKDSLTGMLHGGSLNKVRNIELALERAANTMLSKVDPLETMRTVGLPNAIHDDIYNYSLASDYKKLVDLYPQDTRKTNDVAGRRTGEYFDLRKSLDQKTISIEASEGTKIARINWRSRQGKVLNTMDSLTSNGTWSGVGTASGVSADTIFKVSGNASIIFDLAATGDGIQNTTMTKVDMTSEDEVADIFVWVYFTSVSLVTSVTAYWGNDLTANYWTAVAQTTQADGTAIRVGWNLLRFSWSTATETGTVAPATIDSFKLTVATSGVGTIANIRVDNIIFSIGRNFDIKYYSKYIIKNSTGVWIPQTTSDDDIVILDTDASQIFILESLIACAQQVEGEDSGFDVNWANSELYGSGDKPGLYEEYRSEHPGQGKKAITYYGSRPSRGRW